MITRIASAVALCSAVAFVARKPASNPPLEAEQLLDSLVSANARPLSMDRGRLQGAGAEWLLSQAAHAQFLAIGEEHNVVEIPELVTALLTDLEPRAGYRYVALEQDPVAMRAVSAPPMRGRADSLVAYARRYPHAFTFVSDQELAMVADIGRIAKGRGNAVWGLDQSFGVTHALDRLRDISQGATPEATTNFVSELARVNGSQSFHISVHAHNPAEGFRLLATWPDSFPDPLIARHLPTNAWTIVDLRPLRANYRRIAAALRSDQRDQFARLVFGFDAALYVGGMRPATYVHSPGVAY